MTTLRSTAHGGMVAAAFIAAAVAVVYLAGLFADAFLYVGSLLMR